MFDWGYYEVVIAMEQSETERRVLCFQARARGYLMRKGISSAREEFEDIVRQIDGDVDNLEWRGGIIPIPHFTDIDGPWQKLRVTSTSTANNTSKPQPTDTRDCQKTTSGDLELERHVSPERDVSHGQQMASRLSSSDTSPVGDRDEGTETSQAEQLETEEGVMESTVDTTTVWSSLGLDGGYSQFPKGLHRPCLSQEVPNTPEAQRLHRNNLAMELLWLQQAICSRKKYLSLKESLGAS